MLAANIAVANGARWRDWAGDPGPRSELCRDVQADLKKEGFNVPEPWQPFRQSQNGSQNTLSGRKTLPVCYWENSTLKVWLNSSRSSIAKCKRNRLRIIL